MSAPILISGGGIAGLSSALCLAHTGFKPIVLEQAETVTELGAGIQLSPNASRILHRLGLKHELMRSGTLPQSVDLREGRSGKLLAQLPLQKYSAPYYHIHREDLQTFLCEKLNSLDSEALHFSSAVTDVHQSATHVTVTLRNKKQKILGSLLVVAEGGHSKTRHRLKDTVRLGYTAWRGLVSTKKTFSPTATVWMGKNKHLVSYPVRNSLNVVAVLQNNSCAPLAERYHGWVLQKILEEAHNLTPWEIFTSPPFYHKGRMVFVGDAACLHPPFLAQGAAMAIEDAWTLALALQKYPLPEACAVYKTLRTRRVLWVRKAATKNLRLFHASHASVLHTLLRFAGFFPFLLPRFGWLYEYDPSSHI